MIYDMLAIMKILGYLEMILFPTRQKLDNLINKVKKIVTNVQEWLTANGLSLNTEKTIYNLLE